MNTSILDLADFEAALAARSGAPEIPALLASNAGTNLPALAILAHRAAIVDGTYPMTGASPLRASGRVGGRRRTRSVDRPT